MSGRLRVDAPPWRLGSPPPQGSSLGSGLCCPDPSSLNRPHPPNSQAHPDFAALAAYTGCLRCAGAPRRPASGSGLSLTIPAWHAVLYDPGEFEHRHGPVLRCRHGLRRDLSGSALPKFPQSASRGARLSRLPGLLTLRPVRLLAPLRRIEPASRPQRAFTSRLPAVWSPALPLDMTTTWTGLLVLAGLSPAGMAASLAAPEPDVPD